MGKVINLDLYKALMGFEELMKWEGNPPAFTMDGKIYHFVKGDWVKGKWIDEHYESIEAE